MQLLIMMIHSRKKFKWRKKKQIIITSFNY